MVLTSIHGLLKNVLKSGELKPETVLVKVMNQLGPEPPIVLLIGLKLDGDMVLNSSEPLPKKLVLVNTWTGTTQPALVIIPMLFVPKLVRPPLFSV